MELDELKSAWETLSIKLDKQQKLNSKLIEQMTNLKYKNRLNTIARPEFTSGIICFIMAVVLILNFGTFNTLLLQIFGGLSVLFLIVLPVLSFKSIQGFANYQYECTHVQKHPERICETENPFSKTSKAQHLPEFYIYDRICTCVSKTAGRQRHFPKHHIMAYCTSCQCYCFVFRFQVGIKTLQ
ncbi:MAG: hypothetical protein IPP73_18470 [Chitinophagaceae bacterium]|nr:hypothetical protein [Chitinophagaceae bacterium]